MNKIIKENVDKKVNNGIVLKLKDKTLLDNHLLKIFYLELTYSYNDIIANLKLDFIPKPSSFEGIEYNEDFEVSNKLLDLDPKHSIELTVKSDIIVSLINALASEQKYYDITNKMIPDSSPIKLNTDSFRNTFPCFERKYPSTNFLIRITALPDPVIVFDEEHKFVNASIKVKVGYQLEDSPTKLLEFSTVANIGVGFITDNPDKMKIWVKLNALDTAHSRITYPCDSTIGSDIDNFVNSVSDIIIFTANNKLKDGIDIPKIPSVEINGIDLDIINGGLFVQVVPVIDIK